MNETVIQCKYYFQADYKKCSQDNDNHSQRWAGKAHTTQLERKSESQLHATAVTIPSGGAYTIYPEAPRPGE